MARFNHIDIGTAGYYPQAVELPAAGGALTPGTLVKVSSGTFVQAGASEVDTLYVVQENFVGGGGVGDTIAVGDTTVGLRLLPTHEVAGLVATGQNLVVGDALTSNGTGRFVKHTTGKTVYGYAAETYNNNSGSDQLVRINGGVPTVKA